MPALRPVESVAALPVLEHALLWCERVVAGAPLPGGEAGPRVAAVFRDLGAPAAAEPFLAVMAMLREGMGHAPRCRALGDAVMGAEESILLDALALHVGHRSAEAVARLGLAMPHREALRGFPALVALAQALTSAGLRFTRPPRWEEGRRAWPPAMVRPVPEAANRP